MPIAGLDIGTTGCKIAVYDQDGARFHAYREYPASRSRSEHEVDPRLLWQAVREVVREAAQAVPDIFGLGVSSFGESFALLDERDEPLMETMLYTGRLHPRFRPPRGLRRVLPPLPGAVRRHKTRMTLRFTPAVPTGG